MTDGDGSITSVNRFHARVGFGYHRWMSEQGRDHLIGVISDTHGLLRPEAVAALAGVDHILHAGDVVSPYILDELKRLAPVTAVRGNCDSLAFSLMHEAPAVNVVELAGLSFYLLHNLDQLDLDPAAAGFAAVIHGHTHSPGHYQKKGVLYLNPGSAGPRRTGLPVSLARIRIHNGALAAEIVELDVRD